MHFSNQKLIESKERLLSLCEDESSFFSSEESLSFDFHGIELQLYSKNHLLLEDLKNYLPKIWLRKELKNPIAIYHSQFPNDGTIWEDEESSVVYSQNREVGIQRDFAALKIQENKCFVFFNGSVDDGLHNFMRWFLSPPLLGKKKAILHSSALADSSNKAFLFLGPSGAGKTTITSLGDKRLVLSDDMNLIDFSKEIQVFPGGVGGLYKPQVSIAKGFSLSTAYWIIQSDQHLVKEIPKRLQMRYLLASFANLSWNSVDKEKSEEILHSAETILEQLEIKELYFKKDAGFWDII